MPSDNADRITAQRISVALVALAILVATILLASVLYPSLRHVTYVNQDLALRRLLTIPRLLEPRVEDGIKVFELTASAGQTELIPHEIAETDGFNGPYLGPTLRARLGDHVQVRVTNELPEAITVHWHGMRLPADMDGNPHQPIASGNTWSPSWIVKNRASTLWYHPHAMGKTAAQVYAGLAGLFIIDDEGEDALSLPNHYGVDDIPLIVQDRNFDAHGALVYRRDRAQDGFGELGDTILVNGTYAPFVDVPRGMVRFRLLNASNARRFNFGFSDDRPFHQIASDGGFLNKPLERTRLLLAPEERAEIVVDMSPSDRPITLLSDAVPGTAQVFDLLSRARIGQNDRYQAFKIVEVRPRGPTMAHPALPDPLAAIPPLSPQAATRTRVFHLTNRMSINGRPMDLQRIDDVVRAGDTEIWEVRNEEALFYHTFHIHGVQFQVLERNGKAAGADDGGWKDTVRVDPFETVKLIAEFGDYADPNVPYMFHCHILDHEDMGMMGQFVVAGRLAQHDGQ